MNNKFQYSCIGNNTPENREHLEKLGYRKWMWVSTDNEEPFISTIAHSSEYMAFDNDSLESSALRDDINCIGNDLLFQAVTAMRDDNHIHQWHIIDYDVYLDMPKDYWFIATDLSGGKHVGCQIDSMYYHKATLSELQAHFKRV